MPSKANGSTQQNAENMSVEKEENKRTRGENKVNWMGREKLVPIYGEGRVKLKAPDGTIWGEGDTLQIALTKAFNLFKLSQDPRVRMFMERNSAS